MLVLPHSWSLSRLLPIFCPEETPLFNEHTITLLQSVVDLLNLKEGFLSRVHEAASEALRGVCWKAAYENSAILVANTSYVLDVLLDSLALPIWKSDAFAENAASALRGLAFSKEFEIARVIVSKEGLLASLVNCLYQKSKPILQKAAAGALEELAFSMTL